MKLIAHGGACAHGTVMPADPMQRQVPLESMVPTDASGRRNQREVGIIGEPATRLDDPGSATM